METENKDKVTPKVVPIREFEIEDLKEADDSEDTAVVDIYKELLSEGELILTVNIIDEPKLRRTLTVIKARDMAKLKESGYHSDDSKLEFIMIKDDKLPRGLVKVHIVMKQKPKIRIYGKQIPSGDLAP